MIPSVRTAFVRGPRCPPGEFDASGREVSRDFGSTGEFTQAGRVPIERSSIGGVKHYTPRHLLLRFVVAAAAGTGVLYLIGTLVS